MSGARLAPTALARTLRERVATPTVGRADWPWLGWPLVVGVAVAALYLATNTYPAYGAGLYTHIADAIRENGYALPASVPHYGPRGVPMAYPPLALYGLAALRDLGAGAFETALYLPPLLTVAALVPAYLLGRDVFGDPRAGTAVALLLVLNPQVLEWHLSAGGLVRATALLVALWGVYAADRVFRGGDPTWVPLGGAAVGLVGLTHPTYAVFVVATYLLFWVGHDRSLAGLVRGALVAAVGLAIVAPWLVTVADIHGLTVFTGAAGTHGGLGGGLYRLQQWGPTWALVPVAAGAGLLATRYRVLGLWTLLAWLGFAQPRFTYVAGAFAVVAALVVLREREVPAVDVRVAGRGAVVALLVVSLVGLGGVGYELAGPGDGTTPEFVDGEDEAAMQWARTGTAPDATFVVLGDAAEWFPAVADRTILVSPWGAEWRGAGPYGEHLATFKNASNCDTARCLERQLDRASVSPDYVYVPKGAYTVRGTRARNFGTLDRGLERRADYEVAYENEGVVVFERTG